MQYSNLPASIKLKNGITLKRYVGHFTITEVVRICKETKKRFRIISVLSGRLKGKTDLHGNPYKPSKWIFTNLS